jgi:glycosyltransferase involved in cell wall biosynthesis
MRLDGFFDLLCKQSLNAKLHILYLCSWFPNRYVPFLGNFVENHAQSVGKLCRISTLYVRASKEKQKEKFQLEEKLLGEVYSINIYYQDSLNPFFKLLRYIKAHLIGITQIQKKLGQVDGIHLHVIKPAGLIALLFKWKFGLKYLITEHSTVYLPENRGKIGWVEQFLVRLTLQKASLVTVVSKHLGQQIRQFGQISDLKVINNVVDENLFRPQLNEGSNPFTFIHISTVDEGHKNPKGILRAFSTFIKKNQDARLIVISDGNLEPIKTYSKLLGMKDSILFVGPSPASKVAEYIQKSDCLVLFSNYENMPVVLSEAWMCGIPVISSDVGGISENLHEKNGILIKAGEEAALLGAFEKIYSNHSSYSKDLISKEAKGKFSSKSIGNVLFDIYSSIFVK